MIKPRSTTFDNISQQMSSKKKVLPNFLICGAPKAATTTIYNWLNQHDDVFLSTPKEPGFFHLHYEKGIEWYLECFNAYNNQKAVGEASVMTMSCPEAPERIFKHIPDTKLIFVLRNPIDRAISNYFFDIQMGWETPYTDFSELIRSQSKFANKIIELGMYTKHLNNFNRFFDNGSMEILLFEDLKNHPLKTMNELSLFLGIDPAFEFDITTKDNPLCMLATIPRTNTCINLGLS